MKHEDMIKKVRSKYQVGQSVTMDLNITDRKKEIVNVRIIAFYPNMVLTQRGEFKESFTYWEMLQLPIQPQKKEVVIPENLKKQKRGNHGHKCG